MLLLMNSNGIAIHGVATLVALANKWGLLQVTGSLQAATWVGYPSNYYPSNVHEGRVTKIRVGFLCFYSMFGTCCSCLSCLCLHTCILPVSSAAFFVIF